MRPDRFWKLCEIQLYALLFALPFEYYFGTRDQPLLTNLKIQVLCFFLSWVVLKTAEFVQSPNDAWQRLQHVLPHRLLLAMFSFAVIQALAAAFAPEFRDNALRAAAKTASGFLVALVAADISSGSRHGKRVSPDVKVNAAAVISFAGLCMALFGFGDLAGIKVISRLVSLFQSSRYLLGDSVRFVSTMEYPNTAASFLSVALCATVALIVYRGAGRRRFPWNYASIAAVVILGIALSLTYSRGAIGATMLAIGVASWLWRFHIRERHATVALGVCFAVLFGGACGSYLVRREAANRGVPAQKRIAHYGLEANATTKYLAPDQSYQATIAVRNVSSSAWSRGEFGVAGRWHDVSGNSDSPLLPAADFQTDIAPGQSSRVKVSLNTPAKAGEYVLIWFIFHRNGAIQELKDSYSPGILCVISSGGPQAVEGLSSKARRYLGAIAEERRELNMAPVPGRSEFWLAALRMFLSRPLLGLGPDNFRIRKWEFMEIPMGDETILANSLYLELLSGSGALGLLSFLWLLWECGRLFIARNPLIGSGPGPMTAYLGTAYLLALIAHGFLDYFLKFTPTFLIFWLLVGILCSKARPATEGSGAHSL